MDGNFARLDQRQHQTSLGGGGHPKRQLEQMMDSHDTHNNLTQQQIVSLLGFSIVQSFQHWKAYRVAGLPLQNLALAQARSL
jgi:hypothetical protein